jgi:hypothetical protein
LYLLLCSGTAGAAANTTSLRSAQGAATLWRSSKRPS